MTNNNEADYSLDFEVPSENDTSQLHSEILEDDIENSAADAQRISAADKDFSPPFSPDTPQQQQQQYQQQHENRNNHQGANQNLNDPHDVSVGDDNEDEGTPKSKNQELDEIEDIIRKLEKLEKAQTILEDALHLSDAEADLPDISERSEKTEKSRGSASGSKSKSRSSYRSANSSQNNGQKGSKSKSKNYSSSSEADNGDIDREVDLRNDEELSAAINSGIESIRKLIEKDISPQEDIIGAHPQSSLPHSPPSQSYSSSRATDKKSKSGSQSRSSHNFYNNGRSKLKMEPKPVDGSGDSSEKTKASVNNNTTTDSPADSVGNLKNEIVRQEALILAYQKENEKLYVQLKVAQEEIHVKEKSHEDELNDFKTQIATLKLSRLVPMPGVQGIGGSSSPRLGSAHKGELDRLNEELTVKSLMIVELRKEIALLKMEEQSRPSSAKVKQTKLAQQLSIDKEKEYQDNIRGLQKQVRTLQRILYNKDTAPSQSIPPSSATSVKGVTNPRSSLVSRGRAMSLGKFEVGKRAVSAPNSDSEEIRKLEDKLRMERQSFQQQLSSKEVLLEENNLELNALRSELSKVKQAAAAAQSQIRREENRVDSDSENIIMEQLQSRLLNQSEIIQTLKEQLSALKNVEMERNALRREVANYESRIKELQRKLTRAETLAKPSFRQTSGANSKMDNRSTMNQEKEKEYQKQVQNLQKQVRTLQKILYNKDSTGSAPGTSTAGRASGSASREDLGLKPRPQTVGRTEILKRIEAPMPSYGTTQLLQSTLEHERQEFENLLSQKQRQVEDRERQIRELKAKLSATIEENAWIASESSVDKATYDEFRTKILTQNKIIDSLKHRLASYGNTEAEKSMLRKEISHFEFRVQDLQRKLARAENLAKPENEVLTALSEKVEDLHTRYYYRERQLDALLDRLSLKTGQSSMGLSPRVYPTSGSYRSSCNFNGNSNSAHHTNHSDDYNSALGRSPRNGSLDLGDLSPSTALNLIPHRDVPEI